METRRPDSRYVTRAEFEGFKMELKQEMQAGISQLDDYYAARDQARDELAAEMKRDYEKILRLVEDNWRTLRDHSNILASHGEILASKGLPIMARYRSRKDAVGDDQSSWNRLGAVRPQRVRQLCCARCKWAVRERSG